MGRRKKSTLEPIKVAEVPRTNFFRAENNAQDTGVGNPFDLEEQTLHGNQRMWSVIGDTYFPCDATEAKLPPGQYIPMFNEQRGFYVVKKDVNIDELMILPDSKSEYIISEIHKFWQSQEKFKKHGFLWKRGVMLVGLPGGGKTSTLQLVAAQVIEAGGIALYCNNPSVTAENLRLIRRIEPERPVVLIMEDIDAIINVYGEQELLALLDGELQVDNILYIATTNYPDRLDARLVQRPSRFDDIVEIGMPSDKARDVYLKSRVPNLSDKVRAKWVAATDGFPIAALKEMIVSIECLGRPLEETVERLRGMLRNKPVPEEIGAKLRPKMGFM